MTTTSKRSDTQTILLSPLLDGKDLPAFQSNACALTLKHGQLAKVLASAFLKFITPVETPDTVQEFMALAQQHRLLTDEASSFLSEHVLIIAEDEPLDPLVQRFAQYRLEKSAVANPSLATR